MKTFFEGINWNESIYKLNDLYHRSKVDLIFNKMTKVGHRDKGGIGNVTRVSKFPFHYTLIFIPLQSFTLISL